MGNLLSDDGARYGFQLTFFQIRAVPRIQDEKVSPGRPSAWRTDQVFVVHTAVSDILSNELLHSEKLEVITLDLRIKILPNMADQEMQTPRSTRVTYWEGSVRAEGSEAQGRAVTAEGYVELTGYAGPVEF